MNIPWYISLTIIALIFIGLIILNILTDYENWRCPKCKRLLQYKKEKEWAISKTKWKKVIGKQYLCKKCGHRWQARDEITPDAG